MVNPMILAALVLLAAPVGAQSLPAGWKIRPDQGAAGPPTPLKSTRAVRGLASWSTARWCTRWKASR